MRDASARSTIEIYTQARIETKQQAQQRLVEAILIGERDELVPEIPAFQKLA